ncbi:MAG: hypothetical protein JXR75_10260 [Rhodobacteraceae bacterium]|nr:hypothetical protein [Paracoccaceae bacterium]
MPDRPRHTVQRPDAVLTQAIIPKLAVSGTSAFVKLGAILKLRTRACLVIGIAIGTCSALERVQLDVIQAFLGFDDVIPSA